jgi:hypothetical protein
VASIIFDEVITEPQIREDGTSWPLAMIRGEQTILADHASEIIAYLIPDYDKIPQTPEGHDSALVERWKCCVITASDVQSMILVDRAAEGAFVPANEPEWVINALFADKLVPVEEFESWPHPNLPLVLIATDYAPYTERTPVTGNVLWLDPADEILFLHSLNNIGAIQFYTHEDS